MSIATWNESPTIPRGVKFVSIAATGLFLAMMLLRLTSQYAHTGSLYLEDDAYYYTVIAHNFVQTGLSSFDGQTLSNGYHPLWLALLVLQDLTFGTSTAVTIGIELILTSIGLLLCLGSFRTKSVLFQIAFAVFYAQLAWPMIARGMEISLLFFAFGLFVNIAVRSREEKARPFALGFTACLCIGARLDAAVFVLPMLILVLGKPREIAKALLPAIVLGSAYAIANFAIFGVAFPVSGSIKSLGGFQLNTALLDQIDGFWQGASIIKKFAAFFNSFVGRPIAVFIFTILCLAALGRNRTVLALGLGYLAGFCLFALKLMLFSSWVVWPWYSFSSIIGLFVIALAIDNYLDEKGFALNRAVEIIACVMMLAASAWQLRSFASRTDQNFEDINRKAVATLAPVFGNASVAMGDRAGSFAAYYPGGVTQLEGLVNDRAYYDDLRKQKDIKPLLCARGVRYVLSYQPNLGQYETTTFPVLRHRLTHYPSPQLTFAKSDEVGRVFDLAKYDNSATDAGDNYLYAWRLSGCPNTAQSH